MIVIDGSVGEGGGQVLRTSLSLSMITGQPVTLHSIRAKRAKPGLMRQHLACVEAARAISDAEVEGAALSSRELVFRPRGIRSGSYRFEIGSAGSTTLVLQTVLPALLMTDGESDVTIVGGTHNPLAPPFEFLAHTFLPLVSQMGATIDLSLLRHGFFPAGGGSIHARIVPTRLVPITLDTIVPKRITRVVAFVANLPLAIAERELAQVRKELGVDKALCDVEATRSAPAPGNFVRIDVEVGDRTETFIGLGERSKNSERVARDLCDEVATFLGSPAPVDDHLADQLLLPLALAGSGSFLLGTPSDHATTNAAVIERFLPVSIRFEDAGNLVRCVIAANERSRSPSDGTS